MTKSITQPGDLAVNGASPYFPAPVHVGRPNIGDRDMFMRLTGEMLDRLWLSNNGPLVQEFEQRIAERLKVKHCVAMCNGTVALEIAIRAMEFTGEVIVPSYTFVATAHALHWQGITPVFADIDPRTHNIDPVAAERMITPRTSGIIGVHVWGRPAPVEALADLAERRKLGLLFDAAHAFDCTHDGRSIGNFGSAEVLSFHATKFFNTFEGGAVVTNDDKLAEKMRLMRNFGFVGFDRVEYPGTNGKMVEVCAAMGIANLSQIDATIAANRANHRTYQEALADVPGVTLIDYNPAERNNYHYLVAEVDEAEAGTTRDDIVAALHAENILARKYFWPGAHRMEPYRSLFPHADMMLPHTEAVARRVIVLPNGNTLPPEAPGVVASVIKALALAPA
jgi:dTDP-4-amino-4,6-dideoxygalactose transaminase